jgi:hypothetical protein
VIIQVRGRRGKAGLPATAEERGGRAVNGQKEPLLEVGKQFRRVNGHLHLPALRAALEAEASKTVPSVMNDEGINAA